MECLKNSQKRRHKAIAHPFQQISTIAVIDGKDDNIVSDTNKSLKSNIQLKPKICYYCPAYDEKGYIVKMILTPN